MDKKLKIKSKGFSVIIATVVILSVGLVIASVITYLMVKLWKQNLEREYPALTTRSASKRYPRVSNPYILPNEYFAKVIGCAKSTASTWRKQAVDNGYLFVEKRFRPNNTNGFHNLYKRYGPEDEKQKFRTIGENAYLQDPDAIISNIVLRKRRIRKQKVRDGPG